MTWLWEVRNSLDEDEQRAFLEQLGPLAKIDTQTAFLKAMRHALFDE